MEIYEISKIQNAVEVGIKLRLNWFRGHSKLFNNLTPKIFRKPYIEILKPIANFEFCVIEDFKFTAPAISNKIPNYDDNLNWLLLMQHHGTPTRLLDWSDNILVALYFAVRDDHDEDGELWCLNPYAINERYNFEGLPTPVNPILKYLSKEPSLNIKKEQYVSSLNLKEIPAFPLAFSPTMNFPRIYAQISRFTIHPIPQEGFTLTDLLYDEKEIFRYIIRKENKENILRDLDSIGINECVLFQDLDGLSKSIELRRNYIMKRDWQTPPKFKYENH